MAEFITPFDPTATNSGTFPANLPNGGWIIIHNESPVELAFQVGTMGVPVLVPAYVARCFPVKLSLTQVRWQALATITAGQAPISQVYGELYEMEEWNGGEFYIALTRQVNLGNQAAGGAVSALINDGNAANTQVVEATQTGSSGSNLKADNSGNFTVAEYTGTALNKLLQIVANAAVGASSLILGKTGGTTEVQGALKVDGSSSLDAAKITTDGTGTATLSSGYLNVTTPSSPAQPALNTFFPAVPASTLSYFSGRVTGDAVGRIAHQIRSDGYGQSQWGNTANTWHLWASSTGLNSDAPVAAVANIATAGPYGVPLVVAVTKDLNIVNSSLTIVANWTTPNDGANHDVRVTADLFVGGANTNNGTVTLKVQYTDPHAGVLVLFFNVYGQANLINGIVQAKGQGIRTDPRSIRCTPNSTVTVFYTNGEAGVISDFSSALVELMS